MVPVVLACSRAGTGRMGEAGQKWGLISGLVIKVDAGMAYPTPPPPHPPAMIAGEVQLLAFYAPNEIDNIEQ